MKASAPRIDLHREPVYDRDFPKHSDASVPRKIPSDSRVFLTSERFHWIHSQFAGGDKGIFKGSR
jgi:hypothetical protein